MLNNNDAVKCRELAKEITNTAQSLTIFSDAMYWGTLKTEPDEADAKKIATLTEWTEESIQMLFSQIQELEQCLATAKGVENA